MDEELELKITRFINGYSATIANKVDLQHYLSFDDVRHQAIKVKKQLKGRMFVYSSLNKSPSTHIKIETPPPQVKVLNEGKGITSGPPKRLKEEKYFKCHGFGHF